MFNINDIIRENCRCILYGLNSDRMSLWRSVYKQDQNIFKKLSFCPGCLKKYDESWNNNQKAAHRRGCKKFSELLDVPYKCKLSKENRPKTIDGKDYWSIKRTLEGRNPFSKNNRIVNGVDIISSKSLNTRKLLGNVFGGLTSYDRIDGEIVDSDKNKLIKKIRSSGAKNSASLQISEGRLFGLPLKYTEDINLNQEYRNRKINGALASLKVQSENRSKSGRMISKPEIIFGELLSELNISYETQYKIGRYSIDYYLPIHELLIEVDGMYKFQLIDGKLKYLPDYENRMNQILSMTNLRYLSVPTDDIFKIYKYKPDKLFNIITSTTSSRDVDSSESKC